MSFRVKRVYEPPAARDGTRVLVDRLWPRGLSKAAAAVDVWLREIAPSDALRRWFAHDPARWTEFVRRYARELERQPATVARLSALEASGVVTLLFAAHDAEHNNAVALEQYLAQSAGTQSAGRKSRARTERKQKPRLRTGRK